MYILKNAFKNLGRNKGRNILLGIIIFIIILSTTIALVINTTTNAIIDDYKNRFGSKVTLSVDFDKLMEDTLPNENGSFNFPTATPINPSQYMDFATSDHLRSFLLNLNTGIIFNDLEAIGDNDDKNGMVSSIVGDSQEEFVTPKAKLLTYSDRNKLPGFDEGLRKIVEGDWYQNKNECLISSDFAKLNNLQVNDEFEVVDANDKKTVPLKIVGIYADATKENGDIPSGGMSLMGAYGNRRNEIIVNIETMTENFDVNHLMVNATYELLSPDHLNDFEKELREKGLPIEYKAETDEASYNKIVAPVLGLSKISMTFMWVVLLIGGIILLFITSMVIRERKYEIGVLRAMGLKKSKVGAMLIVEMMMITILCLGIGLGVGSVLSQPIADTLIGEQVEATKNNQDIIGGIQISNGTIIEEEVPLSEISVSLTMEATLQICFIALLLALLASSTGVIFITKYEPTKILSERN